MTVGSNACLTSPKEWNSSSKSSFMNLRLFLAGCMVWEVSKTTGASVVVRQYDAKARSLTVQLAPGDGRLFLLQ